MLFKAERVDRGVIAEFWDITKALFYRDCKQKFGEYKLGVFWGVLEPVVHIVIFTLMLSRNAVSTQELHEIPYFVMAGLIPFFMFRNAAKGVMTSCKSNNAAFFFPIITPLHAVSSKVLYEVFIYMLGFVTIYSVLSYMGFGLDTSFNVVMALCAVVMITLCGLGVGLVLMVFREFFPSLEKWANLFFRPLYFASAIFYSLSVVPEDLLFVFYYNPCVHAIEFVRQALLGSDVIVADWLYLVKFMIFSNLLGFMLFTTFQDKLRSR